MSGLKIIVALIFQAALCTSTTSVFEFVADFCRNSGKSHVTVASLSNSTLIMDNSYNKMAIALQKKGVYTRKLTVDETQIMTIWGLDNIVFMEHPERPETDLLFDLVSRAKVKTAVVVLLPGSNFESFMSKLSTLKMNSLFYLIYDEDTNANHWKIQLALTMNNVSQVVLNKMKKNRNGQWVEQNPDLEGFKIACSTLAWDPFLVFENCKGTRDNCTTRGYMVDYIDSMASMLNFTWSCVKDNDIDNWGVKPTNNINDRINGTWNGAMGGIVNGKYMLGVSSWVWNEQRQSLLDFVLCTTSQSAMAVSPRPPEFDIGLFIRPFRDDAWNGCGITLAFMFIGVMVPRMFLSYYDSTDAQKIVVTSTWYFFVLINAYYGGALTMFFTTEPSLPFSTREEVMELYPTWKLKFLKGMEVEFLAPAQRGDPLFVEFWNRTETEPSETTLFGFENAFAEIRAEPVVMFSSYERLRGYIKKNPFQNRDIKVFGKAKKRYSGVILTYNSPLTPFLTRASSIILESGSMDYLTNNWIGPEVMSPSDPDTMVLTASQLFLGFVIVLAIAGASLFVFIGELWKKSLEESKMIINHSPNINAVHSY